ncbi:MAG: DUF3122 domain-containing protein [Timaviella obliquedivisa GSE-PSE-MK23-08B]|jgi:hypothetical protein|nr:DUF3122 domain-containing protein [Timaviella obliquedivisa GSE-PSE-MK23-08B]
MKYLKSLLLAILIVFLTLANGMTCSPAAAEIRQFHESPGKLLYKSQWALKDQTGKSWQAIAFQVRSANSLKPGFAVRLRLVGFPNSVTLSPLQPLRLDDRQQFLTASNISVNLPPGAIGEFDIQPILSQLNPKTPLYLTLTTKDASTIDLKVPPFLVEEWQGLPNRLQ